MASRTLWSLLEDELDYGPLLECGYEAYRPDASECTVLLCGTEMMDIAGAMGDPHDTFFVVALDDPLKELPRVPKTFDAWIDARKIGTLPTLLAAYENHIERKQKQRFTRSALQNFMVNSDVHKSNLEAIKGVIRTSSQEIESIFESRVEELKDLQDHATLCSQQLSEVLSSLNDDQKRVVDNVASMTQEIEQKAASVAKAMRAFIVVLQCEDRISQMIDGVAKIIDHDIQKTQEHGLYVPLDKEAPLKASLAEFYTIQEQRDFAMGVESALTPCSDEPEDGFILF